LLGERHSLVFEYETEAQQAKLELARIDFDQIVIVGFISADDLDETLQITQMGARDFLASIESPRRPLIVDVRSAQEWSHDHLEGAIHVPLPQLLRRIGGFSRNAPVTVVCGSGYRSSIAASLLESEGFERLANVMGGMHAVRHAKRPRLPIVELAESAITWEI
jgi:hydroxyacylglutathione hydrolase